ncbi:RHS repeat-associated core domain-containing protein [Sorangium sp. So ce726]|uniref:RHS repeat-associated core domain-containing protein n=1 Tax=Sorangium sp. So ce726 TaxID=3133319 RepID=UPI003F5ED3EE
MPILTDEDGDVIERRSYDPFGQRRNPVWGERPPASFPSETTQGFTGHESDDELGLVNMKGRIYDPRIGRFLTTDPIVSIPSFGQSWNPYSYVRNSPLNHVDPSGFQEEPVEAPILPVYSVVRPEQYAVELFYSPPKANQPEEGPREAVEVGATTAPIDVGTTGSSSGYVPQPVTVSPEHSGAGGPGTVVGQTLLGAAEGTRDLGAGIARMLVLNALTLGMYSGYEFGSAMWEGYEEDGLAGALNAVNPLYEIGRNGADTALAIDRSDYRAAGAAGVKTILLGAARRGDGVRCGQRAGRGGGGLGGGWSRSRTSGDTRTGAASRERRARADELQLDGHCPRNRRRANTRRRRRK